MQLSPQSIRAHCLGPQPLIVPFIERKVHKESGLSGGLSCAGYDVHMGSTVINPQAEGRIEPCFLSKGLSMEMYGKFVLPARTGFLAVTKEKFHLPHNICMLYFNKSTLARRFINAAATLGEPGWHGHLTLELYNQTDHAVTLYEGQPIGQVIFQLLDMPSETPYTGKYQGQASVPVEAKRE